MAITSGSNAVWYDDWLSVTSSSTSTDSAAITYDTTSDLYVFNDGSTITAQVMANAPAKTMHINVKPGPIQKMAAGIGGGSINRIPTPDPRVLSKFLNASDLLEEFIKDVGELGVRQAEVLSVPIELFVNWLIVKAAEEEDHLDQVTDIQKLPAKLETYRRDRCRSCGQYIEGAKRKQETFFCSGEHYDRYLAKVA